MQKKELRKLRRLNATKAMIRLAAVNEGKCERKESSWHKTDCKRKYGIFMRAQNLGKYIKIAIFIPDDLNDGRKKPRFEVFLNVKGSEYITREWGKDETELWRTARIDNLDYAYYVKGNDKYSYMYYSQKEAWMEPSQARYIAELMGMKEGSRGYKAVRTWQERIQKQNIAEKERREQLPWDEDMKLVPDRMPDGFEKWWQKEVISKHFIFYTYDRDGAKEGYCSYCESMVQLKEKPKHNLESRCPKCHRKIIYKADSKVQRLETTTYECQLVQRTGEGIVVRYFEVWKSYRWRGPESPDYKAHEYKRVLFFEDKVHRTYKWGIYKNKFDRWIPGDMYNNRSVIPVYRKNMTQIFRTFLKKSSLKEWIRSGRNVNVGAYLIDEEKNPVIEKLVKIGLLDLAGTWEIRTDNNFLIDKNETELTKMLRLDRMRLERLKKINPKKIETLEWMQMDKLNRSPFDDGMISYFGENGIKPSDIAFVSDKMTFMQIYNYMRRQQQGTKDSPRQILRTWDDYYSMAATEKMDVSNEQIYKPKDLRKAHADVIAMREMAGMDKLAGEKKKKWPKVDKVCRTLQKYEYKGDKYCIVAPKGILDIVKEGTILKHCIHTCDFYYDRMEQQESYILFLRRAETPDTPYYTLEVEPGGNIRQKRTVGDNQNEDFKECIPFLNEWQQWVKKNMSREEKKLAERSDMRRKKNYKKLREDGNRVWHGKLAGQLLADVLEADFMEVM
ncbi:PcfJ domain-containing protein [Frisingicoccus sp.]|uniref:PcfJ domain-containing protein n=1 Tax=Frisingicoccus sp. TaxID=1918627 RepID=UPI0025C5F4BE|nr:PcfJ domain-containing protein [Frisingicoccus sp.]